MTTYNNGGLCGPLLQREKHGISEEGRRLALQRAGRPKDDGRAGGDERGGGRQLGS